MTQVYVNSAFNISACASENGHKGLYRNRNLDYTTAFVFERQRSSYLCFRDTWFEDIDQAPLGQRAWVVQERFLAPHVIHFGQQQMHFECLEMATSETLPDDLTDAERSIKLLPPALRNIVLKAEAAEAAEDGLYRLWYTLVYTYADCDLTYTSDRPVAILGLAQVFRGLLGLGVTDYIYVMWRPRFIHALMWFTYFGIGFYWRRLREDEAPSWSWLSVSCGIWPAPREMDMLTMVPSRLVLTVQLLDLEHPPSAYAGRLHYFINARLRAPLCEIVPTRIGHPFRRRYENIDEHYHPNHVISFSDANLNEKEHFDLRWDDNSKEQLQRLLNRPLSHARPRARNFDWERPAQ